MNCNIIKDLIPLYIDDCCSEESKEKVKEHLADCESCKQFYCGMSAPSEIISTADVPNSFKKLNHWKASVLQSVLLFISFAIITLGVAYEANTAYDHMFNSLCAINIVVPATGFMLSLANWYFVKIYKSRKLFSSCSLFITFSITLLAYIWCSFHYEMNFTESFSKINFTEFADIMQGIVFIHGIGFILTLVLCILSKFLSDRYARMLGKE